jgi:hypothetical protein
VGPVGTRELINVFLRQELGKAGQSAPHTAGLSDLVISPKPVKGRPVDGARGLLWVHPGLEQNLRPVDIANTRNQVLRHQDQTDRLLAALDALPEDLLRGRNSGMKQQV